jgi:hypothetical protein
MPTLIEDNSMKKILLCLVISNRVVVESSVHDACCSKVGVDVVVVVVVVVVGCVGVCPSSMMAKRSSMSLAIRPVIAPRRMHNLINIVEMFDQH